LGAAQERYAPLVALFIGSTTSELKTEKPKEIENALLTAE
jgi:hypothetical protein